jgi:hypothetical protein
MDRLQEILVAFCGLAPVKENQGQSGKVVDKEGRWYAGIHRLGKLEETIRERIYFC